MDKLYATPIKAIRKKCLDCTCYQPKEVRLCPVVNCPLYPYRMGTRPSQATIDTLKEFYGENRQLGDGFLSRKAFLNNG